MWLIPNLENPTYRLFVLPVRSSPYCISVGKWENITQFDWLYMPFIDKLSLQARNGSVHN